MQPPATQPLIPRSMKAPPACFLPAGGAMAKPCEWSAQLHIRLTSSLLLCHYLTGFLHSAALTKTLRMDNGTLFDLRSTRPVGPTLKVARPLVSTSAIQANTPHVLPPTVSSCCFRDRISLRVPTTGSWSRPFSEIPCRRFGRRARIHHVLQSAIVPLARRSAPATPGPSPVRGCHSWFAPSLLDPRGPTAGQTKRRR